ncbi:MAG: BON domain-containing protein [Ilumatobacteraceae bacterium]
MSSEPRGSWRKILPLGLLALAGLFVASAIVMIPWVQNDLTDRVEAKAAQQGIAGVSADFDGQDGTIRCSQPVADLAELKRIVRGTWGVRVASYEGCTEAAPVETTAPAPVAAVSELAATSTVSAGTVGVVLAGVVDTQAERVQLVADASEAFGADNVTDRLTVAGVDGVDSDADAAALGALTAALAGDLVSGEAGFDGRRLYLRGVAADAAAEARLRTAAADAGAADPDVELSVAERGAPVVTLGADGKLRLTGTVETEAQRQALLDAAVATYGAANVIDELEVLGVEPATQDDDIAALAELIAAFDPDLASGEAGPAMTGST